MKQGNVLLLMIFLFFFQNFSFAQKDQDVLSRIIQLKTTTATVEEYFSMIEKEGIVLSYNPNSIPLKKVATLQTPQLSIEKLITEILAPEKVKLVAKGLKIILIDEHKEFKISGFIKEDESGETLPGATVLVMGQTVPVGAVSNESGFFSLSLPAGNYTLTGGYLGYEPSSVEISLNENKQISIYLKPATQLLKEVEIKADNEKNKVEYKLNPLGPGNQSSVFFNSIMTNLQFLPGVVGNSLLATKIQVRGGNASENLVLLDGIPVYNYSHLGSILSIFNGDAIKSLEFYRGGFPARYEGRLSSVMDIQMKDGDKQHHHGALSLDFLSASAMLEGPVQKNKSSYLLSFRRSWLDLGSTLPKDAFWFYVYDFNMKLHFELDKKKQLLISAYKGADTFKSGSGDENQVLLKWTNFLTSVQLKQIVSPVLFNRTAVSYSHFLNFSNPDIQEEQKKQRFVNQIDDVTVSTDFDLYPSDSYTFRFGSRAAFVQFNSQSIPSGYIDVDLVKNRQSTIQASAYFEGNFKINSKLTLDMGVNSLSYFPVNNKTLHSIQPRLMLKYFYRPGHFLYAGFSRMAQFYHQLTINGFSFPFELRIPSIEGIKPSKSDVVEGGYKYYFAEDKGLIAGSLYFSSRKSILNLRPQQDFSSGVVALNWKDRVITGKGNSWGLELLFKRDWKWVQLQGAYTWSNSRENYDAINYGKSIRSAYDIPHLFNGIVNLKLGKSSLVTTSVNFQSGMVITAPRFSVPTVDDVLGITKPNGNTNYAFDNYYQYRLPFNYHVNVGYIYTKRDDKGRERFMLRFGIYNLIGRHQPFNYNINIDGNHAFANTTLPGKFIPYAGFNFKF